MQRGLLVALVAVTMATVATAVPTSAAPAPVHTLAVSGTGVGMYPAFDPATERYGVTTTDASGGSVVVTATTSDPSGNVRVNGRRISGGTAAVTGLTAGDEISVLIEDEAGTAVHSLVYLPPKFPAMSVTGSSAPAGHVLLTLSRFMAGLPNFETAVDRNGVPAFVRSSMDGSLDLKRLPDGGFTVSREPATDGKTGSALVELDDQFRPVGRYETASPLVNTDGHDSILRPDGSRILIAYEYDPAREKTDAVIQEVDADGEVTFTWSSADHVVASDGLGEANDYAHINSIEVMADGDILASFRHLSQVLKIARTAHDGFQPGDVVWRLGGRRSDFTFVDDPYPGGPCAQHTATQLPNGHILIFDNGSWSPSPLCVDPANPSGPPLPRTQTRIAEYALDTTTVPHTATLVWDYEKPGRFALFAGSAQRLQDGNTLVGWASERQAIATLVDPAGVALWELADASSDPQQRYFTYRAAPATVPDAVKPVVDVARPEQDATYALGQAVTSDFGCTDRGGSSLASCQSGSAHSGGALDTTVPGTHALTVTAVDGSGNLTSVTRTYRVATDPGTTPTATPTAGTSLPPVAAPQVRRRPDGLISRRPDGRQVGGNVYGRAATQSVRQPIARGARSVSAVVRFQNDGNRADRIIVLGTAGSPAFRVRYFVGGTEVTRRVTAGTYRTPLLSPGRSTSMRVRVTRTAAADAGDHRAVRLRGTSAADKGRWDAVRTVVHARS